MPWRVPSAAGKPTRTFLVRIFAPGRRQALRCRFDLQGTHSAGCRAALGSTTVFQESQQVGSVATLEQGLGALAEVVVAKEAQAPGDLLGGADLQALAVLCCADKI